jgi:serine/threonine protein phosphatase PrpC
LNECRQSMPEVQKLRIGYSADTFPAHSGVFLSPLIGMDPAANDWLHSPDEIGLGDFGVLLMLSSSSHPAHGKQSASQFLSKVIKQLFDQTLDLPHDDEGIIALLEQYLMRAHQMLCDPANLVWQTEERLSCSSLGLIRQKKLYLVWVGDIKWYRYNSKGTSGSYFTEDSRWQMLTVDHTDHIENILTNADVGQSAQLFSYKQQLGQQYPLPICSKRIVPLYRGDTLVCTQDYLQSAVGETLMLQLLGEALDAQSLAVKLLGHLQHSHSSENHAVMVAEIIEAPVHPGFISKDREALLDEAKQFFGLPLPVVSVKRENTEKRKLLAFNKPKDKISDNEIEPMGVRTVLPFDDYETDTLDEFKAEAPVLMPLDSNHMDISAEADELPDPKTSGSESSGSKLRIRLTVYPDPEDSVLGPNVTGTVTENESLQETSAGVTDQDKTTHQDSLEVISDMNENLNAKSEKLHEDDAKQGIEFEEGDNNEEELERPEADDFLSIQDIVNEEEENEHSSQNISSPLKDNDVDLNSVDELNHDEVQGFNTPSENDSNEEEFDIEVVAKEAEHDEIHEDIFETEVVFPEDQSAGSKQKHTTDVQTEIHPGSDWMQNVKQFIAIMPRWVWFGAAAILIGIIWFLSFDSDPEQLVPAQKKTDETTQSTAEPTKPKKTNQQEEEKAIIEEGPNETESKTIDNPKVTTKKDDKKKIVSLETEPEYDEAIKQNKLQLLDEVNTLWSQKKTLCRKISSYRNNAPARKQEKLDPLVYDCEQLEEKFSSIYDPKSGFFRTTRYDFLTGTLNNIKVSLNRAENRLDEIRQD